MREYLQRVVDPLEHFDLRYRVREVHHSDGVSHTCTSIIIIESELRRNKKVFRGTRVL